MSTQLRIGPRSFAAALFLLALVVASPLATPAVADAGKAHAAKRSPVAKTAKAATARYRSADRAFVRAARTLNRCRHASSRPRVRCAKRARLLQHSGRQLAKRQRLLGRVSRRSAKRRVSASRRAPVIVVDGTTLTWERVGRANTYILVRKERGEPDVYSVVNGTSVTPKAAPGEAVRYSVRTAVTGSLWASEVSISYPSAPTPSEPAPTEPAPGDPEPDQGGAPVLSVRGQTLTWTKVADATRYVLVAKVPGKSDRYWVVEGASETPPAVPGATVAYGVRADVDGGRWAEERTITYPAAASAPAPAPAPAPTPEPAPSPAPAGGFHTGIVAGSAVNWELRFVQTLGARVARMEFSIGTPATQLEAYVDAYAKAGIRPLLLAGFHGRTPTVAEAKNLAGWAAAFGPGGTFWQGKSYPAGVAVTEIEFGNESSYNYQYDEIAGNGNWANTTFYRTLATQYALRFKDAHAAIQAANANVGLLAVGDTPGNWGTWMDAMFDAVPDLGHRTAGWTIHPYGPDWQSRIDGTLANAKANGAPGDVPIYVTELGVASDDGRCLGDNYGWSKCMTYAQSGAALTDTVASMRGRYGSRLRAVYLYHAHDLEHPGSTTDREDYFGALRLDGTAKGALTTAVKSILGLGS